MAGAITSGVIVASTALIGVGLSGFVGLLAEGRRSASEIRAARRAKVVQAVPSFDREYPGNHFHYEQWNGPGLKSQGTHTDIESRTLAVRECVSERKLLRLSLAPPLPPFAPPHRVARVSQPECDPCIHTHGA